MFLPCLPFQRSLSWHLRTWFSDGVGIAGFIVRLSDLFSPKSFCNSVLGESLGNFFNAVGIKVLVLQEPHSPLPSDMDWHWVSSHSVAGLSQFTFSCSPSSCPSELCLQGLAYIVWDQCCALRMLLPFVQSDVSSSASGGFFLSAQNRRLKSCHLCVSSGSSG